MQLIKKIVTGFVLIYCSFRLDGQDTLKITFNDAVKIALKQSYIIKSFNFNQQSMQYYFSFYKSTFKPRLDINLFAPSLTESVTSIPRADSLPVYNSVSSMHIGGDLKFTYTLPTGGNLVLSSTSYKEYLSTAFSSMNYKKLYSDQVYNRFAISLEQPVFTKNKLKEDLLEAELQYRKSICTYTRAQMDIIYSVSEGFYHLYCASKEKDIANEKMMNSKESFRIAKLKFSTGNIPEGDVLIAEITAQQDRTKLLEANSKLEREKDNFKQLIGLDINKNISIVTDLKYDIYSINLDTAINQGLSNRLELGEAQYDVNLQQISTERAKREGRIKGSISAYYDFTGLSTLNRGTTKELFGSSLDNLRMRPPNRSVIFTISIPIADWGRAKSLFKQENCKLEEKKLALENAQNTIIREIRDIVRTVEESKDRLSIYEKNKEVAIKSYKISQIRFSNGELTSQELAVEQERLSSVQLEYLNAYITYQLALADLKRKTMWDFQNNRSYKAPVE